MLLGTLLDRNIDNLLLVKDSNLEIKYLNIYYSDFCGSISMDSSMAWASYFPVFDFHITNTYNGG